MSIKLRIICITVAAVLAGLNTNGYGAAKPKKDMVEQTIQAGELGLAIGSVAEVFAFNTVPVQGFALVGGLNGTGSTQCPTEIRNYLEKYVMKQLPDIKDVGKFFDTQDNAAVMVFGTIPPAASKNQKLDIGVAAIPGTDTTSLDGGVLWGADMRQGKLLEGGAKVLATAEGPIYIDKIDANSSDKRSGYIIGGGKILEDFKIRLMLRRPDFKTANDIRYLLNGRFGSNTASAVSPSQVDVKVPPKYQDQKERFMKIMRRIYLTHNQVLTARRIDTFVKKLGAGEDLEGSEIALEAIGKQSLTQIAPLLKSDNENVRLYAARCMLDMGSNEGLETLRNIAMDGNSKNQIAAIESIGSSASRNDATAIMRRLLRDKKFDIRIAAYEQLKKLDDVSVVSRVVAKSFSLEQISNADQKGIYLTRRGEASIVLFGSPIYCREDIFVESKDGGITINAPKGQKYVTIMRKHPKRSNVTLQLKSSLALDDIIETLCGEPDAEGRNAKGRPGLGVSYSDAAWLLKQMCEKGAVEAEFKAGPLPKVGQIVKK
jgi:flagellar basal body P-ring protein FlgI